MRVALEKALPAALEKSLRDLNQTVGGEFNQAASITAKKAEDKGSLESLFDSLLKPLSSVSNDFEKLQKRHSEIQRWIEAAKGDNPDSKVVESLQALCDLETYVSLETRARGSFSNQFSLTMAPSHEAQKVLQDYVLECVKNAIEGKAPPSQQRSFTVRVDEPF